MMYHEISRKVKLGKGLVLTIDCITEVPKAGSVIIVDGKNYKVVSIESSQIEVGKVPRISIWVQEV